MGDLSRGVTFLEGQTITADDLHSLVDDAALNPRCVTTDKLAPACVDASKLQPNCVPNSALAQANPSTLKGNLTNATANVSDNGVMTVRNALDLARVDVGYANPMPIGAAASGYVRLTTTGGITAFDNVPVGIRRVVLFSAIMTLTYNATSLILPRAQNLTTAVGDTAEFVSEGNGNWRCLWYSQN